MYSSLSIISSTFLGAFSVSTAYTAVVAHRLVNRGKGAYVVLLHSAGAIAGLILAVMYFPLADILGFKIPPFFIFSLLSLVSILMVVRSRRPAIALLLAVIYSLYGIIVLKMPLPVAQPLTISISGIFGASSVLISSLSTTKLCYGREGSIPFLVILRGAVFGLISSLIISYFPAISLSLAAFLIAPLLQVRDEDMVVASGSAATSSLLLTAYGKNFDLTRSSFAASLPEYVYIPRVWSAVSLGVCAGVVLALILAPLLYRMYSAQSVKFLSILFVIALAFSISGIPGILLSISSIFAGTLTNIFGVEKRIAMFFLLAPTLLYYAPI